MTKKTCWTGKKPMLLNMCAESVTTNKKRRKIVLLLSTRGVYDSDRYRFDRYLFDFWHANWITSRWTLMKIGLNFGRLWLRLVHSRESGNRLTWKRKLVGENYLFYSAVRKCHTHTTVQIVRKTQHKWGVDFLPMPQCGGGMHCPSIRFIADKPVPS